MARTEIVTLTNMCMICDGTRVLVQNRKDPDWPGITFPGEHVEKGEAFTDAVIREVFEETGLTIASPKLCGIKDWTEDDGSRYMVLLYKTDRFSGTLKSSDEGEVFFTSIDSLRDMPLSPNFDKYLEVFLSDKYTEIFCNWNEKMKENCNGEPKWNFQYR